MEQWVRLCALEDAPQPDAVMECETAGVTICLANIEGELSALDNWCPHRRGSLGGGWVEGPSVVCPWHSWAFNATTGIADPPERARVAVFPVKIVGQDVLIALD